MHVVGTVREVSELVVDMVQSLTAVASELSTPESSSVKRQVEQYHDPRVFSALSAMDEERLSGLALVNAHCNILLDRRINKYICYKASKKDKVGDMN